MAAGIARTLLKLAAGCAGAFALAASAAEPLRSVPAEGPFTIAVVPDTQNYVDFNHQRAAGFPFDARDQFLEQMDFIASNARSAGGDIVFVTAVGDLWQHQTLAIDPAAEARGMTRAANAFWAPIVAPSLKTLIEEVPTVLQGYRKIAGRVPFSVTPGNHDYDAMWSSTPQATAAGLTPQTAGALQVGGLYNFINAFSPASEFFRDKDWYVASHDHGADSAQLFSAGGYRFLHIALQFDPPDASLAWAASMIERFPGLPTLVTTHNYLDASGARTTDPVANNHLTDPRANTPEMVWDKLISQHDQIFMVLCGHREGGQGYSVALNRSGHQVHQLMSNYQGRRQTAKASGASLGGIGDGWMRLMRFDLAAAMPYVRVRTYSTYYKKFSTELPEYAAWHKGEEHPEMSDEDYLERDDFTIDLKDFRARFGDPQHRERVARPN